MIACTICRGSRFERKPVLWPELIDAWKLRPHEVDYIDRQQGECCLHCGSNLRSIALAQALLDHVGTKLPLAAYVTTADAAALKVLEINQAGSLHTWLAQLPGLTFGEFPAVDMAALDYEDGRFDIVVHSDTLEHVPRPAKALEECRRVLKPGGALCFTVPIVVERLTRSRDGLALSFHGAEADQPDDYAVCTEYGADAWTMVAKAGFTRIQMTMVDYPAAIAITATR